MAKVTIPDKVCPHCGGTEWYVCKNTNASTFRYDCVLLIRERGKKQWSKNREKYMKRHKEYIKNNPLQKERQKILQKKWRENNKEHLREANKKWREANPEKVKASFVKFRGSVKAKACSKRYHDSHKEEQKKYRAANTEKLRNAANKRTKYHVDNLTELYLKKLIRCDIHKTIGKSIEINITKEQFELYRQSILAYRQLKQLKKQIQ